MLIFENNSWNSKINKSTITVFINKIYKFADDYHLISHHLI